MQLKFSCKNRGVGYNNSGESRRKNVSKLEKLMERLKRNPKDFTFEELQTVLEGLGFQMSNKGRTSGSRVKFLKGNFGIVLHKPHSRKELLEYQVKQVVELLGREGLL
jgi:hypothetical protein